MNGGWSCARIKAGFLALGDVEGHLGRKNLRPGNFEGI